MSLSPERRPRDGGFTLVEIIVALGILMVVVVALLPQLVVGIRSTGLARTISQAKGVAQGQLDRMRNMPFHVSPAAGDYRDVLDFYYRNLTAGSNANCPSSGPYVVPQVAWSGYVTTGTRCRYEPVSGAFYRKVEAVPASAGNSGFTVVVDTQFLSGATPPVAVTPPTGYDTQATGKDTPASAQIGITVTVVYTDRGTVHPVTTYTQLSDQPTSTIRIRAETGATTLEMGSVTTTNGPVSFSSGLLKLVGSLTYASTLNGNLSGTTAGVAATGEQKSGASTTIAAPPTSAATTGTASPDTVSAGCDLACWDSTRVDVGSVSAEQGLPNAGSATSPMQSLLTSMATYGLRFGNGPSDSYRTGLGLAPPLVRLDPNAVSSASGVATGCVPGSSGTASYVTASGYLTTTSDTVDTCAVARTASISLFPTGFAPRGVVLIELHRATARCLVTGTSHTSTASSDYDAEVKYFDGTSYQSAGSITPANGTTDPLDSVNLSTTSVGGGHVLGDYIASWSSLLPGEVIKTQSTGVAEVRLPGVVTIASQPVRPGTELLDPANSSSPLVDPTSVVSVTLGALNCSALDQR